MTKDQRGIMKAHDQYSINPELAHFDEPSVRMDSVVGGWRETVLRLYNDSQPRPDLHPDCLAWLDKKCEVGEPIDLLHKRELLSVRVLDAAVCSIMLSFASIQFLINQKLRGEPNLFVRALFLCAQRLEEFVHNIDFSKSQILNALEFYRPIRSGSNLEETDQCFQGLRSRITTRDTGSVREDGLDETDGPGVDAAETKEVKSFTLLWSGHLWDEKMCPRSSPKKKKGKK